MDFFFINILLIKGFEFRIYGFLIVYEWVFGNCMLTFMCRLFMDFFWDKDL